MCKVTFVNEHGRRLSDISVTRGTTWRDALAFIYAERELEGVRCVPYGKLAPLCMDSTVQGDCCIVLSVDDVAFMSVIVLPRQDCEKMQVRACTSLKDALRNSAAARLWSGEELVPMWDPATNTYRDPMSIETPVQRLVKPVRVLARVGKLYIDSEEDIEDKWPYAIEHIEDLGDGLWEVHSHDAYRHIVRRGTHYPVERAKPKPKPQDVGFRNALLRRPRGA